MMIEAVEPVGPELVTLGFPDSPQWPARAATTLSKPSPQLNGKKSQRVTRPDPFSYVPTRHLPNFTLSRPRHAC
jgi:hypothetical protein